MGHGEGEPSKSMLASSLVDLKHPTKLPQKKKNQYHNTSECWDADASTVPSGEKHSECTRPVCRLSSAKHAPSTARHNVMASFASDADARVSPLGEKHTVDGAVVWIATLCVPSRTFQRSMRVSANVARVTLSRDKHIPGRESYPMRVGAGSVYQAKVFRLR